jgi:hypothetical protein
MNKVLLVGFLLAIATQSLGQGIVVQNSNPTSSIANRGSYIADSIFRIGTRDTVKPSWWNPAWSFNGALQIGLDGKPYYYFGGYWRGVGSGVSVTSITQGYGMALSPSPIVSTGSVSVDTTAISTKANVNSLLSAKLNISDTSAMLLSYLRKADTASLSNRINLKLNIADTNSMLGGYLRKVDTSTLSTRIDARVKYVDTAAMLAPYATDAQVALKLNIADTANMRIRPIAGSNMTISGTYPNVTFASTTIPTDSTIFATNYRVDTAKANLRTSINTKLNSADTASLSTRIDARVKYSDTSTMLGGYLRKVDTASLSNRINAAGNDWKLTGNAGTSSSTNFIGTTDNVDLVFKRNNVTSGWINSALFNTSFGVSSMPITATGNRNSAFGSTSLNGLTSGTQNVAMGYLAASKLSTASDNIAIGYRTLGDAGLGLTGNSNVAIGSNSMLFSTTATRNAFVGYQSGYNITTGQGNAALGWGTLSGITTGTYNTAIGDQTNAGTLAANFNTSVGGRAAYYSTSGNGNTSIGNDASFNLTTGSNNTTLGGFAGQYLNASLNNVYLGYGAGNNFNHNAGDKNLLVGYNALPATFAGSNQLNLGNVLWGSGCSGTGQTPAGSLSVGATAPNASAIFDIVSTTKGLGLPSMTTTQQNAIATPRAGLAVYNSTLSLPTFYNGTTWSPYFSGWGLTGNAGTSAATNFIGTTDDIDLMFRRNNISSGRISANNAAFGNGAGAALTSGANNSLFGAGAGGKLTNPSQNTYFGFNAGSEVVSGFNNIYIGAQAGAAAGHTAGNKNLVISHQGMVATNNGANQLNIGNVLWGVDCSATGTTAAGSLSIGVNTPNASALLDLTSTTKGLLLPRMTTTEINAIATPAAGLMVYNTTINHPCFYNGTSWQRVNHSPM